MGLFILTRHLKLGVRLYAMLKVKRLKPSIALHGNPSQSYGASLAIWDHSYSVTCHPTQVNVPRHNPQTTRLVLNLPSPEGWKAELI